jgi:hypothetical protein
MLGTDGNLYVVKFQNNPQHTRVLANELFASRIASVVGLSVPETELIEVPEWLVEKTPELEMDMGATRERCRPGLQFGSRFAGGLLPGRVVDYLPDCQLEKTRNLSEFAGILALDKWTANADGRQAVFVRKPSERKFRAVFIDFGYCFHAHEWKFDDSPLRGIYYKRLVYQAITGWDSFDPWLTRLEAIAAETVWQMAKGIPPEWYGGVFTELEVLVERLLARRSRIRELIKAFRNSDAMPFPNWRCESQCLVNASFESK